jgi:membrane protein required for colicin V production
MGGLMLSPEITDLTFIAIVLISAIFAFVRGLTREFFSIAVWVGAGVIAYTSFPYLQPMAREALKDDMLGDLANGLGSFCLALAILIPLSNFFVSRMKGESIAAIDRSLGFVYGLLRGVFITSCVYLVATVIYPKEDDMPDYLKVARSQPVMEYGAHVIQKLLPKEAEEEAADKLKALEEEKKKNLDAARSLEQMQVPVPAAPNNNTNPSPLPKAYDEKARDVLDNLIEQKASP